MWKYRRRPSGLAPSSPPSLIVVDPAETNAFSPLRPPRLPPPPPSSPLDRSPLQPSSPRSNQRRRKKDAYDILGGGIRSFAGSNNKGRQAGHTPIILHEDASPLRRVSSSSRHKKHWMRTRSSTKPAESHRHDYEDNNQVLTKPKKNLLRNSSRPRTCQKFSGNKKMTTVETAMFPKETAAIVLLTELEHDHHRHCHHHQQRNSSPNPAVAVSTKDSPVSPSILPHQRSSPQFRHEYGNLLQEWASASAKLLDQEMSPATVRNDGNEDPGRVDTSENNEEQDSSKDSSTSSMTALTNNRTPSQHGQDEVDLQEPVPLMTQTSSLRRKHRRNREQETPSTKRWQDKDDEGKDAVLSLLDVAIDWTWELFGDKEERNSIAAKSEVKMTPDSRGHSMPRVATYSVDSRINNSIFQDSHGVDVESQITMESQWGSSSNQRPHSTPPPSHKSFSFFGNGDKHDEVGPESVLPTVLSQGDDEKEDDDEEEEHGKQKDQENEHFAFFGDSSSWEDEEDSIAFITSLSFDEKDDEENETNEKNPVSDPQQIPEHRSPPSAPRTLELPSLSNIDTKVDAENMEKDPQEYANTRIASALSVASTKREQGAKESLQQRETSKSQIISSPFPSGRLPLVMQKDPTRPEDLCSTDAVKIEEEHDASLQDLVGIPLPSLLHHTSRTRSILDKYCQKGPEASSQSKVGKPGDPKMVDQIVGNHVDGEEDTTVLPQSYSFEFSMAHENIVNDEVTEMTDDFDDYTLTRDNDESIDFLKSVATDTTDGRDEYDEFALTLSMCQTDNDQEEFRATASAQNPWGLCAMTESMQLLSSLAIFWPAKGQRKLQKI